MSWAARLQKPMQVAISRNMRSATAHKIVANRIRKERDALIQSGVASAQYVRRVDGKIGLPEEAAKLNGGNVSYIFSTIGAATVWALAELRQRSPCRSGAFRKSWAVLVNGKGWTDAPGKIPMGSEVRIVNTMPYARKIEVGGQRISVPPGIVEAVRRPLMRRFKRIRAQRAFKPLQGGRDARGDPLPYILKGAGIASGISWDKKEKKWTQKHAAYVSRRADRQAGEQMLYPTLILTEK
ncbi:hypothetical protein CSR02_02790 [Acetobacter pomorum]|uniref:Uncharacterized protein n=1 Tax=Acetobacter pomorum TaxID=65959 RepID=A0A2G4RF39_9PROT|nr:hypothetical protein [Acetobacter pomorum]PHY95189.1 hypothetical protein CSR02_02790 [Acetobacter pomorum]GBR47002.1 hypothetical protein AA11825_0527 [Acetobacter pomorum DSM 11825]